MNVQDTRLAAILPFTAVGAAGIGSMLLPPHPGSLARVLLVQLGLVVLIGITFAARRWTTAADGPAFVIPPLLFLALLVVLMNTGDGEATGLAPLVALPALWVALYGTRRQLYLIAAGTAAVFLWPLLLHDARYPAEEWRRALLWVLIVAVICPVVQHVVRRLDDAAARQRRLAASLASVLRAATDHAIIATDRTGTITLFSEGAERMLGYRADEVIGRVDLTKFHDPDELRSRADELGVPAAEVVLHGVPAGGELSRRWTYLHRDGTPKSVRLALTRLLDDDGSLAGWTAVARDVSDEQRTQNRFERLFEESPNGAVLFDAHGVIERVNPALQTLVGRRAEEMVGRTSTNLPFSRPGGRSFLISDLLEGRRQRTEAEHMVVHSAGHQVHVMASAVALRDAHGKIEGLLANVVDISAHKRYEEQLAYLAEHDPLTGLANRRKFDSELTSHLNRCRRDGPAGALLMLDLDNFKQINDTRGHGAGDQLIVSLGSVLRHRMRAEDVVARLGGDEFAVLLPRADRHAAETVAGDIVRLVRSQVRLLDDDQPTELTASVGVVPIEDVEQSAGEIVSTADMTMYDAKEGGRDRYVVHDSAQYALPRTGARIAWTDRIARSLQQDRFVVHAQPVQDLHTGRVTGAELLIRMQSDTGDLVMPNRFLYIAERSTLIHQLDIWMIGRAVELLAQVQKIDPGFSIEVNLSGRSVGNPVLAEHITRSLREHDVDPHGLVLEITETSAVSDIEAARAFAEQIGGLGCRFALDDFGAGFGSFYYLKHLLFDFVKIDGEFVAKAPSNPTDQLIVSSIVGIARGLGKQTIAEFVADAEILEVVTALGVDHAQGYHIGRPEGTDVLLDRIRAQAAAG
jgi:diguanylate cyclase (GGDEF)-like protein/PAS domain S-box-containing protein